MVAVLLLPNGTFGRRFQPPKFERNAKKGIPEVIEDLGYTELYRDGMAYRVSICGAITLEGKDAIVYFTNPESNEKYLKLRVLDENDNILGETGLLKPGEYVKFVSLSQEISKGTALKLKIMGYEPEDYSSAGSIILNVQVRR